MQLQVLSKILACGLGAGSASCLALKQVGAGQILRQILSRSCGRFSAGLLRSARL